MVSNFPKTDNVKYVQGDSNSARFMFIGTGRRLKAC